LPHDRVEHSEPETAPTADRRAPVAVVATLLALTLAVGLGARILGPSDLHTNLDQNKTAAFTLDMVRNGQWILPRDLTGVPTMKPPLVNWIGAPFIAPGLHSELAYKAPSVIAGLTTVALCVWMGRRLLRRLDERGDGGEDAPIAATAVPLSIAAGAAWLGSPAGLKHIYFLRPDMAFAALLGVAWIAATVTLETDRPGPRRWWSAVMWFAAGAAALTKGPLALLVPLYVVLAAGLIHGRWRLINRTGWWWGLPVMVLPTVGWLWLAHGVDPAHVETQLLGSQFSDRVAKGTTGLDVLRLLDSCWRIPALSIERFGLWSALALFALVIIGPRRWFRHPLGPAALWLVMTMVVLVFFANRSGSYLLPAYPAAAILGVYAFARILKGARVAPAVIAAVALAIAAGVGVRTLLFSRGAEQGVGDAMIAFARDAERIVGDDAVAFISTRHCPAPFLMGRTRAGQPSMEEAMAAMWIVMPTADTAAEPVVATPVLDLELSLDGNPAKRRTGLGLYARDAIDLATIQLDGAEAP